MGLGGEEQVGPCLQHQIRLLLGTLCLSQNRHPPAGLPQDLGLGSCQGEPQGEHP